MRKKTCRVCNETKPITEFYKHPQMGDGHLNHCKVCRRAYQARRHAEIMADPKRAKAELERHRRKAMRQYHEKKGDPEYWRKRRKYNQAWYERNPEKKAAQTAAHRAHPRSPTGMERHHWSYNQEHWTDVIFLKVGVHRSLHRHMEYDPPTRFFRTPRGHLLDTKRKHVRWLLAVLNDRARYQKAA